MRNHKNIYALLVAIDAYPPPVRRLNGCVNDLEALHAYLKVHFNNNRYTFHAKTLVNEQATRGQIIDGFNHFQQAQAGDICLFHFSGHGSQQPAPEAFWHLESDHQVESIVCYDSRLEQGKDLIDKEIGYLTWKATKDKDVHFVVIMDCCHAGTNTRLEAVNVRMEKGMNRVLPVEDYLGFLEYKEVELGRFTPPRGRHIHLAAAKADETAKEVYVGNKTHGVFTYALLETLKSNGNKLTYSQLAERINIKVKNIMRHQSPQLETTFPEDKWTTFLNGEPSNNITHYIISYDTIEGWTVNAGALHGFQQGDLLQILDEKITIEVIEVLPGSAKVSSMEAYDRSQPYDAIVIKRNQLKAIITFAPQGDTAAQAALTVLYNKNGSDVFDLVNNVETANYKIHTTQNRYSLTLPNDNRPIFIPVSNFANSSAVDFLNKVEMVIKWQRLLELENPTSSIPESALELTFWQLLTPGQYEDNTAAEEVNWQEVIHLPYHTANNKNYNPAFRLKIKNRDSRALWVSALYLGDDFSVQNVLLPKEKLQSGAEVWLSDLHGDYAFRSIMTKVDDKLLERGITHTSEFIKLIVSTEEINTDKFNQKGFYDEPISPARALSRRDFINKPDWRTYNVKFQTLLPMPLQRVNEADVFQQLGICIKAQEGASAQVRLATIAEIRLAFKQALNITLTHGNYYTPYEFTTGFNYTPGLSIVEFFNVQNGISAAKFIINFDKPMDKIILPLTYDFEKGCFFTLKHILQDNLLVLLELPEFSITLEGGLSRKLFFHIAGES